MLSSISTDHLNVIWLLLDNLTVLLESFVLVLEEAVCSDEHVEFILQKLSLLVTVECVLTLLFLLLTIVKIVLELTQLSSEVLSLHGTSFAKDFASLGLRLQNVCNACGRHGLWLMYLTLWLLI